MVSSAPKVRPWHSFFFHQNFGVITPKFWCSGPSGVLRRRRLYFGVIGVIGDSDNKIAYLPPKRASKWWEVAWKSYGSHSEHYVLCGKHFPGCQNGMHLGIITPLTGKLRFGIAFTLCFRAKYESPITPICCLQNTKIEHQNFGVRPAGRQNEKKNNDADW